MTPYKLQADWAHLSAELWGFVFARLKPENREHEGYYGHHMQEFYQLPEVCKRFKHILRQSPDLHTMLFINDSFRSNDLQSVCAHIAHHRSSVQHVVARCGSPYVEAALTALLSHEDGPSKLATLDLSANLEKDVYQMYDTVLFLVTQFTTLTACTLRTNTSSANAQPHGFDLDALRALPHLAWLELSEGSFTSLQAASHLTYLSLRRCKVKCGVDCGFVSSLVELHATDDAVLTDFHIHGVCACCCLRKLECADSDILAGTPGESLRTIHWQGEAFQVPNSLARLTNLTCIEFEYAAFSIEHVQFGWLSQLPSLRRIGIGVAAMSAEFPESLSTLSNLTSLNVWGEDNQVQIKFSVDWARFVSLEKLQIVSGQVRFTQTLAHLSSMARLKKVALLCCVESSNAMTTTQIALLAHKLGARPDVIFDMRA